MSEIVTGQPAPEVVLPRDGGDTLDLSDLRGQKIVLFFYPKDDTSGCTKESSGFSERIEEFKAQNSVVIGISKDSVKSHDKFVKKHNLLVPLLSDENATTCEDFGVWVKKSMYGKEYMGIERSTFLIDEAGLIQQIWKKVSVPGHVDEVLAAVSG